MPKHLHTRQPRATTTTGTKPTPPPPPTAPPAVIIPPPPPDVPAAAPPPKPAVKAAAPASAGLAQALHDLLDAAPADLLTCLPLSAERIERYRVARRAAEAILRGGK